jgi:hypothetical protein
MEGNRLFAVPDHQRLSNGGGNKVKVVGDTGLRTKPGDTTLSGFAVDPKDATRGK